MEAELILWSTVALCGVQAFAIWRTSRLATPFWLAKLVGVALLGLLLYATVGTEIAAWLTLATWIVLVIVPLALVRRAVLALNRLQSEGALRAMRVAAFLHPGDNMPGIARHYATLAAYDAGRRDEALALCASIEAAGGHLSMVRVARAITFVVDGAYERFLEWFDALEPTRRAERFRYDYLVLPHYYRALAETGNLTRLARELMRPLAGDPRTASSRSSGVLLLCAFAGRVDAVELLLAAPPERDFGDELKDLYRATALAAAGRLESARASFARLEGSVSARVRDAARRRGSLDLAGRVASLEAPSLAAILAIASGALAAARIGVLARPGLRRSYGSLVLIVAMFLGFAVELWYGGSRDLEVLVRLGAFWPRGIEQGQWWRFLTPMVLHFGAFHLAMNTWALTVVGPMVEALIGSVATVLAGVVTSVGAMGCLFVAHKFAPQNDDVVVGGSAAVMGLVGLAATGFARLARRTRDTRRAHQIARGLFTAIVAQTMVDLVIPGISVGGHLGGAACGVLIGLLVPIKPGRTSDKKIASKSPLN